MKYDGVDCNGCGFKDKGYIDSCNQCKEETEENERISSKNINPTPREYPTIKGKDAERFINRQRANRQKAYDRIRDILPFGEPDRTIEYDGPIIPMTEEDKKRDRDQINSYSDQSNIWKIRHRKHNCNIVGG